MANSRARALMVLGTSSHAGKTAIAAGLCRSLARRGLKVAPFKAQNMSLNSFVTPEGAEIGRAQALQARACGIEPHGDMNPILLKPAGEGVSQVVVAGKPIGTFGAREYYRRKAEMRASARAAYDRLAARFDYIVLEGAGSPAEINLRDEDLVNLSMAEHADARCLLVADIERGGVFASIFGTLSLLPDAQRKRFRGTLINKFRGDVSLLDSGIAGIQSLTGVPVLGVMPFLPDLALEEEDSLGLPGSPQAGSSAAALLDIVVIRFPYLSNATDFQPLEKTQGLRIRYETHAEKIGNPDLLVLPGSKNVRHDAEFLRARGLDKVILAAARRGIPVLGVCGGFQILGRNIEDPHGIEGEPGATRGLGLLPVETRLEKEKELARVEAENLALPFVPAGAMLRGYEIHMGRTTPLGGDRPALQTCKDGASGAEASGFADPSSSIFGVYLHGLFDAEETRAGLRAWLCERRGLDPECFSLSQSVPDAGAKTDPLDRLADALESSFDPLALF